MVRPYLLVVTALLWLALLVSYAGGWGWPFDLFANFRLQYAALFLLCAGGLLAVKMRWCALLAVVGLAASGVQVVSYAGWFTPAAADVVGDFRFVTFNTWYRNRDHARIAAYLERVRADVVVLQEITAAETLELRDRLPAYPYAFVDSAKPHGATVLSRWPIERGTAVELTPDGVKAAHVEVNWRGTSISVVGVHLHWPVNPAGSRLRNRELQVLAARATQQSGPLLIGGDFNTTPWSQHYRRFIERSGLTDCVRGRKLALTWPAQFAPLGLRIDHCFASRHWQTASIDAGPYLGSDHRPTVVDLHFTGVNPSLQRPTS